MKPLPSRSKTVKAAIRSWVTSSAASSSKRPALATDVSEAVELAAPATDDPELELELELLELDPEPVLDLEDEDELEEPEPLRWREEDGGGAWWWWC
jgi:hypothetical protein